MLSSIPQILQIDFFNIFSVLSDMAQVLHPGQPSASAVPVPGTFRAASADLPLLTRLRPENQTGAPCRKTARP
jgi:hypothetical protein